MGLRCPIGQFQGPGIGSEDEIVAEVMECHKRCIEQTGTEASGQFFKRTGNYFEFSLPAADNACPGGAEFLTAILFTAAAHNLLELRIELWEVAESHGDNWCVGSETPIAVLVDHPTEGS